MSSLLLRVIPTLALTLGLVGCMDRQGSDMMSGAPPKVAVSVADQGMPSEIPQNIEKATSHSLSDIIAADAPPAPVHWPRELVAEMIFPEPRPSSAIPQGFTLSSAEGDASSIKAFAALRAAAIFQIKKGNGERQLVVFSDPSSSYDRAFFDAVSRADGELNATIHVLPLATGYESSLAKEITVALSCMTDPGKAWQDWSHFATVRLGVPNAPALSVVWEAFYLDQKPPGSDRCAVGGKLMDAFGVANQVGVDYTPTMVFANGQSWPGPIIAREEIEKMWWYVESRKAP